MLVVPYISLQEFRDTYVDVDLSKYTDVALNALLVRASSLADTWCKQQLRATVDTYRESMYPSKRGTLQVWPKYRPVRSVSSLSYQYISSSDWSTCDLSSGLNVFHNYFEYGGITFSQPSKLNVQYTYVNGFTVTELAANAGVGNTSITLVDATGVNIGDVLTICDNYGDENVTVESVNGSVVSITPLVYQHNADAYVSGIPNPISNATGMIAANLILRGSDGQTAVGDKEFKQQWANDSVITSDIQTLLQPYKVNL